VSRGVLSGWERAVGGMRVKTDAFVSPGSSGGAAFDERWELVGVPVSVAGGDGSGMLGIVVPIDAVPAAWWRGTPPARGGGGR
jgi:S1-C subfamily serine protease